MRSASEALVIVLCREHGEASGFFSMEGARSDPVQTLLCQCHIITNDINYRYGIQLIESCLRYHRNVFEIEKRQKVSCASRTQSFEKSKKIGELV